MFNESNESNESNETMLTKSSSQMHRQRGIAFLLLLWIDRPRSKLRVLEAFGFFFKVLVGLAV